MICSNKEELILKKGVIKTVFIFSAMFVAYFVFHAFMSGNPFASPPPSEESYYMPPETEAVSAYVTSETGEKTEIETSEAENYPLEVGETLVIEYDNGMISEITDVNGSTVTEPGVEDNEEPIRMAFAYVIDENGERTDFNQNQAEEYIVQEGETLIIEYDNGWVVETTVK